MLIQNDLDDGADHCALLGLLKVSDRARERGTTYIFVHMVRPPAGELPISGFAYFHRPF
jgi:hypothetical protein